MVEIVQVGAPRFLTEAGQPVGSNTVTANMSLSSVKFLTEVQPADWNKPTALPRTNFREFSVWMVSPSANAITSSSMR